MNVKKRLFGLASKLITSTTYFITLFPRYNIGRWNVTALFLNMLKADAMTIGNHEFDHDVEGVVPFLDNIDSPVVIANVDDSEEPTFQSKYMKSIVIDKYERKIGVIGAILRSTNTIAKTGNLISLKILRFIKILLSSRQLEVHKRSTSSER